MGVINAFTGRALFIVNSSTTQQAEQSHIRTAELFEQLDPKDMIRKYKKEGRIGAQLFMSNKTQTDDKFRFWSNIQGLTIFLVPILFVFCFISSWWFLIPALLFLVLNAVAYAKRMKLLGRNPATRDINDVV
jgi:hypothetical protein